MKPLKLGRWCCLAPKPF